MRLFLTASVITVLAAPLAAAPPIPAKITPAAAQSFYPCGAWMAPFERPRPSGERIALRGARDVARRSRRLFVAGRALENVNAEDETDREWFEYVGRLTIPPIHVVLAHPYEGVQWNLIDAETHSHINVRGLPVASPSGRMLATAASDPTFDQRGVQLFERGREIVQVGGEDNAVYPCDLHWVSDDRLEFLVSRFPNEADGPGYQPRWFAAALVRLADRWVYQPPPEIRQ